MKYPKIIKKIVKGDVELIHSINLDMFGMEKDYFELIKHNKDGSKIHLPFLPPVVVNDYKIGDEIKFTNNYTDKDYKEMFKENIPKLNL